VNATKHALDLLEAGGVKTIDTARFYPDSEDYLGQTGATGRFAIDTKYPGGFAVTASSTQGVIASAAESLKALKTEQVCLPFRSKKKKKKKKKERMDCYPEFTKELN